jgi:thiamine transport system substrate-binding protein
MRYAGLAIFSALIGSFLAVSAMTQAAEKPTLTVYTYSSFSGEYGPGNAIKAAFEKTCQCTLSFTGLDDTGALLARLKLESNAIKADVVLGLDSAQIEEARPLMQPHGHVQGGFTLPHNWTDAEFMPFDFGHIALVYDENRLAKPPQSLKELVENTSGPKIIVQDPRTSAPGFGFLVWMKTVYGEDAGAAWKKLRPRIVTFTKGWSEAYELFLKNEADMVVSYSTSPAYHIAVENKTHYKAAVFAEGHVLQIEVMGITKATQHGDLARQFIAFMLSQEIQQMLPEGNWMLPAKLPPTNYPPSFSALRLPEKTIRWPESNLAAKRQELIDEWLKAIAE